MVVELNGLAGCGKTTLADEIFKAASHFDIPEKKCGVSEFGHNNSNRVVKAFYKIKYFARAFCPPTLGVTVTLLKKVLCAVKRKSINNSVYEAFVHIAYIAYLLRNYRKAKDFLLIVDEGLVQLFTALEVFLGKGEDLFALALDVVEKWHLEVLRVDIECDTALSLKRIEKRNRSNEAKIDSLSKEQLEKFIHNYEITLLKNREKFSAVNGNFLYLYSKDSVKENTSKVLDMVRNTF